MAANSFREVCDANRWQGWGAVISMLLELELQEEKIIRFEWLCEYSIFIIKMIYEMNDN